MLFRSSPAAAGLPSAFTGAYAGIAAAAMRPDRRVGVAFAGMVQSFKKSGDGFAELLVNQQQAAGVAGGAVNAGEPVSVLADALALDFEELQQVLLRHRVGQAVPAGVVVLQRELGVVGDLQRAAQLGHFVEDRLDGGRFVAAVAGGERFTARACVLAAGGFAWLSRGRVARQAEEKAARAA